MAGHSVAIDFWICPDKISHKDDRDKLATELANILGNYLGELKILSSVPLPNGDYIYVLGTEQLSLSVKMYKKGLISSSLEYMVDADSVNKQMLPIDEGREIEKKLASFFEPERIKVLPALKRAPPMNPYFTSSDDRIVEYDVEEIVYENVNKFQKVQVLKTKSYGNLLALDDLQNLAESDLPYTHGLMNKGIDNYKDKEILILGGGDGALLWELLKENPKHVLMIDIDEDVIQTCRQHLRSACGNCMDNYKGENYEIIIGDAFEYMKNYIKDGRSFDYVFADLTDCPIVVESSGKIWDFIKSAMEFGCQLIKHDTGRYMTHAIGVQCTAALKMFEKQLDEISTPVSYTMTSHYIPSFCEKWCFYQATRTK